MKENLELLAPAGNEESFKAAVNAGADAIYMGLGKHNARVMAKNFTLSSYIDCIKYAHVRGVKVYLTLNTLLEDDDIKDALELLIKLYEAGLDAVILQDIGLASIIHDIMPDLHMHASTQMSAYSLEQVKFLESIGFKRVVLARELTLEEVKYITDNTSIEIEAFIHGALCVSLSGQCLLSLAIGTRSANKGACAQPCRMRYTLYKDKEKMSPKTYLLSKKDIYGLDILDKIIESNITSLKIEGRNKSPEYVALVISTYRKYIDMYKKDKKIDIDANDEKNLIQMFNRNGKSHGYLDGIKYKNSITTLSPKNTGLYLGEVIEQNSKFVKVKLEEDIDLHDGIEIYSKKGVVSTIVTCIKDDKGNIINKECHKGEIIYLGDIKDFVSKSDKIYKTSRYKLNLFVQNNYLEKNKRRRELVLNVNIKSDSPVTLSAIVNGEMYTYNTNVMPEPAQNKELTLESIESCFSKTVDTGISFTKVVGYIQKGLFLRVSQLNDIRRNFVEKIEEKLAKGREIGFIYDKLDGRLKISYKKENIKRQKNILSVYKYNCNIDYYKEYTKRFSQNLERIDFQAEDYVKYEKDIMHKYSKYNLGIVISNFVLNNLDRYLVSNLEKLLGMGVSTIVLGSFKYLDKVLELKKKYEFNLVADYSFNVTNSYSAMFLNSLGFDIITPGFDATNDQINKLNKVCNIELVNGYITAMSSRYCMIGSFVEDRKEDAICSSPCQNGEYYIEDTYGEKYNILCNNIDCVMRIIKEHKLIRDGLNKDLSYIRNNII